MAESDSGQARLTSFEKTSISVFASKLSRSLETYYVDRLKIASYGANVSKEKLNELDDQFISLFDCLKQSMSTDEAVIFCCQVLQKLGYNKIDEFRKTAKGQDSFDYKIQFPKVDCILTILEFLGSLGESDLKNARSMICNRTDLASDRVKSRVDFTYVLFNEVEGFTEDNIDFVLEVARVFNRKHMFDLYLKRRELANKVLVDEMKALHPSGDVAKDGPQNPKEKHRVEEQRPQEEQTLPTSQSGQDEGTDDNPTQRYKMTAKPRGVAVIINNKKFTSGLEERTGTDKDAESLKKLFENLGFVIRRKDNRTGEEMCKEIEDVANLDHSKFDCVIVSILTHGGNGKLHGTDGPLVPVDDLTKYFDGKWIGKPKLFIIQACRGTKHDSGIELESTDQGKSQIIEVLQEKEDFFQTDLEDTDGGGGTQKLPEGADLMIVYATVPGYVSWRHHDRGSWFVEAFVGAMTQQSKSDHFVDIMIEVNRRVSHEFESITGKKKQMPEAVVRLTKKLYF